MLARIGGCKPVQPLQKTIWSFLKKLKIDLPYDPAIPLLGIYPKECEAGYYKGTCTPVFIAALFMIAKLWKQSICPTSDKWTKKMWYLYTIEFYFTQRMKFCHSQVNRWNWRAPY
jgi:hypothetical protein